MMEHWSHYVILWIASCFVPIVVWFCFGMIQDYFDKENIWNQDFNKPEDSRAIPMTLICIFATLNCIFVAIIVN